MQLVSRLNLRFFRGRIFVVSLLTGLSVWCLLSMRSFYAQDPYAQKVTIAPVSKAACQRPDLELYNPTILKHLKEVGRISCASDPDWLYLDNGWMHVNPKAVESHGQFTCSIHFLRRINDYSSEDLRPINLASSSNKLKLDEDFSNVDCRVNNRRFWDKSKVWQNTMAGIHRNEAAVKRAKKILETDSEEMPKWNVLILGLDSMSRLHFMRKLPKTYKYLVHDLNADVLEGYNIVGDGTPQALIPILTGFTEPELPDTRKRMPNSHFVNVYPFVWNNYSHHGYVTAFAEDTPNTGIFTYRLNGFKEQPTDHYMRTFYVEVAKKLSYHSHLCLGSVPRHKIMLNWLRQFYDVYTDLPKFAFGFHGELSHDDFNLVQAADQDLHQFLKQLKDDKILDNTFLLFMSDHGHRFSGLRSTVQGKQEERLPFFSIVTPKSFKEKYAELYRNLQTNVKRLSTPFDIYSTLLTLLDNNIPLVGNVQRRSISLFSEIPNERTCQDADVESHWCTCLSWEAVSSSFPVVKEASEAVVDFINEYTKPYREHCVQLILDKVSRAERHLPNSALLKYKTAKDQDGQVADLSDSVEASEVLYQVQFKVFPSEGVYEASVMHRTGPNTFHVQQTQISRVNLYGKQPHCVEDKYPNLRKYCYCKVQLP